MIRLIYDFRLISKDNEKIVNRQGRVFTSAKFKTWEKVVAVSTRAQYTGEVLTGPVFLTLYVHFTNKVHPDLQNCFKGLCDALEDIVYKNDRQIKKIQGQVFEDAKTDFFAVEIEKL